MKRLVAPVVGWRAVPVAAMLGLVLLGSAIRLVGLAAPDGRLDAEGTRMALAADGVLRHGLPRLPTGRVYPRGVVNSYAIAASFALIGRSDFAARLPSAIAGILLIPLLFLLGRAVVGPTVGLAAAAFVTLAEPLVEWSRSPWLPSIFLLLFCAAAYCCHRGFVRHQGRWQLAAAGVVCLALLSYEFGMLLLLALGLYLGARALRGDLRWHRGPSTWLTLALLGAGALLSGTLVLLLRVGTLAGPFSELGFYVTPGWEPRGLLYYLHRPLGDYPWLLAAAVLAVASSAGRRIAGVSFFGILLAVAILVPSFGIRVKQEERYVIAALPLVGLLGPPGS